MATVRLASKLWKSPTKLISPQQLRCLSLHEYQSQDILREFGVPVPRGKLARSPAEVKSVVSELNGRCVIKPQIISGSRTKSLKVVHNAQAGEEVAHAMLGQQLKTNQTPVDALKASKLYVSEVVEYDQEWYFAITFDRENYCPVIIVSKNGGVDVETIARDHPEELHTVRFGLTKGITPEVVDTVSTHLGISGGGPEAEALRNILRDLFNVFKSRDATLLEVNSLVKASDGSLVCLDTKLTIDDAAAKRQKEIFALRDAEHEIPEEVEAEKYGLVYVRMDGNIGNVVNGAGLAMATNDAIALHGGASANFLDAGGQATKETMVKAFEIVLRDERVKTIFVNIYGGITRGDMIAESILGAAKELGPLKVPMVVRLQGTNSELGLKILEEADLGLHTEADFGKAAQKAVELAEGK